VLSPEFQCTCLALRSPAIKSGSPRPKQAVRSTPISGGRRKLGRKVYHRFAGQSDSDGSSLQVGQARNGH
jgi:hypothetical protein